AQRARAEHEAREAEAAKTNGDGAVLALPADTWLRLSQVATIGLFVIAVLWAAYVAQPVVVPVVLAWTIATIVLPVVRWMQERGLPRPIAVILVAFALLAVIVTLLAVLSTPVAYWLGRASEFGSLMRQKLQMMTQPLAMLDEVRKALNAITVGSEGGIKVEAQSGTLVTTIIGVLTPAVSQFVLFMGALIFYLVYQKRIRTTAVFFVRDRDARLNTLRTLSDIDGNMTVYFGTFTIVNVCLGVVTVLLTWTVGLPNPLLWGVLAALLNYVPYIGPAIVTGTLAVVGLLTFPTLAEAAVAPIVYVAIVTVEGHFITPMVIGHQLTLNPFAVFLAIAFCTWLWGPIGAFLAVPLLMALTVALANAFGEEKPYLPE
ncbi:MAG TPA: AI-2E family transporter, partial [Hyphomicrobiaceae bacterium]|nr:AI-2E family transporter [Hyphomicrobiaceae bacterium]